MPADYYLGLSSPRQEVPSLSYWKRKLIFLSSLKVVGCQTSTALNVFNTAAWSVVWGLSPPLFLFEMYIQHSISWLMTCTVQSSYSPPSLNNFIKQLLCLNCLRLSLRKTKAGALFLYIHGLKNHSKRAWVKSYYHKRTFLSENVTDVRVCYTAENSS